MLLSRLLLWRRQRAAEQLRRQLGMGLEEWAVITRLAKVLSVRQEVALHLLITDGLRLRAASAAIHTNDLGREEMPIVRMGKAIMNRAATTTPRELHLIDRTDGLHGISLETNEDGSRCEVPAMEFPIPRAVAEPLLAELRYSCGTDVLSDDIEATGNLLMQKNDEDFRIEAIFPPSGREDGLRAILRATPLKKKPSPLPS